MGQLYGIVQTVEKKPMNGQLDVISAMIGITGECQKFNCHNALTINMNCSWHIGLKCAFAVSTYYLGHQKYNPNTFGGAVE